MSSVYFSLGSLREATHALEQATNGMQTCLGPTDLSTLAAMHDLASLYDYRELNEDALKWFEKTLEGYKAALGQDHPNTKTAEERIHNLRDRLRDHRR